jgi:hypothetical protein
MTRLITSSNLLGCKQLSGRRGESPLVEKTAEGLLSQVKELKGEDP